MFCSSSTQIMQMDEHQFLCIFCINCVARGHTEKPCKCSFTPLTHQLVATRTMISFRKIYKIASHLCIKQGVYKLSEDFAKPYFHKYRTEIHDVTTIWKRNVCSFIQWPRRPNCLQNVQWTTTKLFHCTNSRTHQLRSVSEAAISIQHWFMLFPRDGSSN
jgi:hypothetical protein